MRYVSSRGEAPILGFADVLLAGLADDGGLYVPETWPAISPEQIASFAGRPYAEVAIEVLTPFVGDDIAPADLKRMVREAYATFRHPAVAPLVQIGDRHFVLELFHGPTLAFKDVAMQLLARLMDHVLEQRGQRATIVGATSGDTGGAAIAAFAGSDRTDMFILFPKGRVSPVQQRQMTTSESANVHAVAIEGTFDDCQDLVKAMFADEPFRARLRLSAVNSINWARVMAQVVYYVTSAAALGASGERPVTFVVPTGNFGNLFAGWVARRMGAPIADFVLATNANDILARFVNDGDMSIAEVVPTLSPSMDIQVSSNFERMLWVMNDGNGPRTGEQLLRFRQTGRLEVDDETRSRWMGGAFRAATSTDDEVVDEIRRIHAATGLLVDPHTATATAAAHRLADVHPVVTMGAAHPAKFPDAVEAATGVRPELPDHLADLLERPERTETLPNDLAAVEERVGVVDAVRVGRDDERDSAGPLDGERVGVRQEVDDLVPRAPHPPFHGRGHDDDRAGIARHSRSNPLMRSQSVTAESKAASSVPAGVTIKEGVTVGPRPEASVVQAPAAGAAASETATAMTATRSTCRNVPRRTPDGNARWGQVSFMGLR